jgi:hypothetical protein
MKTLKFRKELVELIKNGSKNSTWRIFDDKNISEGDQFELIVWKTDKPFAIGKVTKVMEKPLGKLTFEDKKGHEEFSSYQEMYDTYSTYYGRSVGPDTKIKIIWFKLL